MSDINQDMQNLLNAYDSNWDDYLLLRKQFIEKYSLSVEKLKERCDRYEKALTEIIFFSQGCYDSEYFASIAQKAIEQAPHAREGSGDE